MHGQKAIKLQTTDVQEIKTHFIFNNGFPKKKRLLSDKVEKYCINRQATDDNIMWRMRFACRITRARIQIHTQNM
jgi:hypothetical protein